VFQGKNIVVSGGSRGIGKAIVKEFAEQGGNVWFTYNNNALAADDLKSELENRYPDQQFVAMQCDISDHDQVETIFSNYLDGLDSVDVLINNAGITEDGPIVMMSAEQWSRVIQTNLTGTFYMTHKLAFKMLMQPSGIIINISSVAGIYGNAGQTNYAASKSGLIGMSKSLSKELASRNIRVNAIAPGFIDTDMTSKLSENDKNILLDKIGLKRLGEVSDVAHAAAFLASDKAQYITGQTLIIDGGLAL
jgi:3-oxoacyl-[acyl-carrier protein] reductase